MGIGSKLNNIHPANVDKQTIRVIGDITNVDIDFKIILFFQFCFKILTVIFALIDEALIITERSYWVIAFDLVAK